MAKEIKKWVTINGNRVPIYEDGSMGGFMEGRKLTDSEKKKALHITAKKSINPKEIERAQQAVKEEKKADKEESDKSGIRKRIVNGDYDHQQGKNMDELESELKKNGLELESADAHDMRNSKSFNDEKVTLYDKDGTVYEGTYNRYSDGGREVVDIKPKKNYLNFEQAKRDGRIDKDADYEDFVDYSPIKDNPNYTKKRVARETADENDAYDREHKEGKYTEPEGRKTYRVHYEDGNQRLLEANSREELDAYLKETEKEYGKATKAEHAAEYDKKDTLKSTDLPFGGKSNTSDKRIAGNDTGYYIDKESTGMGDHYSLYYQHPNSGSDGLKFLGDAYGSIDKLESKLGQSVLSNKGVQDVLNQARGGNKDALTKASEAITSPEAAEGLRKLQERKGSKSIKVGNKEVSVNNTKPKSNLSISSISSMSTSKLEALLKDKSSLTGQQISAINEILKKRRDDEDLYRQSRRW